MLAPMQQGSWRAISWAFVAGLCAPGSSCSPAQAGARPRADTCPGGFRCLDVTVPLDRSGAVPGTIDLPVVVSKGSGPILLALGGGPGQGMVSAAPSFGPLLQSLAPGWRIAFLDQRGTGANALHCPAMQRAGLTDVTVPPKGSVGQCARRLGRTRPLYSTTATVADLDAVRKALGVERLGMLGISYGTYVAERYARAHPDHVSRLVLDSVVPQEDVNPLAPANMRRSGLVLRQLCRSSDACKGVTKHPARLVGRLVRRTNHDPIVAKPPKGETPRRPIRIDGPALFDQIVTLASFDTAEFQRFPGLVKRALRGRTRGLVRLAAKLRTQNVSPASDLSVGLHTATICSDVDFPWTAGSNRRERRIAAATAARRLGKNAFGPFNPRTAAGNGLIKTCIRWRGPEAPPPPDPGPLPDVPTLLLNGTLGPLNAARGRPARGGALARCRAPRRPPRRPLPTDLATLRPARGVPLLRGRDARQSMPVSVPSTRSSSR